MKTKIHSLFYSLLFFIFKDRVKFLAPQNNKLLDLQKSYQKRKEKRDKLVRLEKIEEEKEFNRKVILIKNDILERLIVKFNDEDYETLKMSYSFHSFGTNIAEKAIEELNSEYGFNITLTFRLGNIIETIELPRIELANALQNIQTKENSSINISVYR